MINQMTPALWIGVAEILVMFLAAFMLVHRVHLKFPDGGLCVASLMCSACIHPMCTYFCVIESEQEPLPMYVLLYLTISIIFTLAQVNDEMKIDINGAIRVVLKALLWPLIPINCIFNIGVFDHIRRKESKK